MNKGRMAKLVITNYNIQFWIMKDWGDYPLKDNDNGWHNKTHNGVRSVRSENNKHCSIHLNNEQLSPPLYSSRKWRGA